MKHGLTLDAETLESFKMAYGVTRQLVKSYETVLRLAKGLLEEGVERSRFLLTLFRDGCFKIRLVHAKGIIDRVEEIFKVRHLELGVEPYDWDGFPLRLWCSRPQAKSAKQSVLVKRERPPAGDDEPEMKHTKWESDGSDKDECEYSRIEAALRR